MTLPSVLRTAFSLRSEKLAEWPCLHTAHAQTLVPCSAHAQTDTSALQCLPSVGMCVVLSIPQNPIFQVGKAENQRCFDWLALHSWCRGQGLHISGLASVGPLPTFGTPTVGTHPSPTLSLTCPGSSLRGGGSRGVCLIALLYEDNTLKKDLGHTSPRSGPQNNVCHPHVALPPQGSPCILLVPPT